MKSGQKAYSEKSPTLESSPLLLDQYFKNFFLPNFPINTKAKAIDRLKDLIYYQNIYVVKDYLNTIQVLIIKAGYIDLCTAVIKFKRDL